MLKPARMTRIVVGGHNDHLDDVIEVLHAEGVVHLEDFRDPAGLTQIGAPLHEGEEYAELLLRVRGLQKALDVPDVPPRQIALEDIAKAVRDAEAACLPVIEAEATARTRLEAVDAEITQLEAIEAIDVDLGAVRSVAAVRTFIGTVREDPADALYKAAIDHEIVLEKSGKGLVAVVMVRPHDANNAERALAEAGFSPVTVPVVEGTPAQALAGLRSLRDGATAELATAEEAFEAARHDWAGRLASLEDVLAAAADRASAPLHFGVTANTFHFEGWVPIGGLNHLRNVLASRFGESLYLEDLGDAPMGHENAGHGDDHEHDDGHHEVAAGDEAPTQLTNKGPARNYEFLLTLLALPRYKELDPTKLIAIFFPLFFGLMVGDFAIGIIIMLIALWLKKHNLFGIGGPGVAKPMFWGGFWSMLVGAIIFGEALGMHFVLSDKYVEEGEHSWESVLGVEFPKEGFIHKTDGYGDAVKAESHDSMQHAFDPSDDFSPTYRVQAESTESGNILAPSGGAHLSVNGWFNLGYYSKIHDVQALLVISILIGIVHLVLGLVLGVRNIYATHGLKLAIQEKVSWLLIMASVPIIVLGLDGNSAMLWGGAGLFLVSVALLWMGVQHTIGVGFIAILEIPSLLGNILSYTRLAAIGASKAGMAIAFATIGFELVGGPAGWIIYLLASGLIIVLAILAGFLQSLRLQFVEFFSKFYEGGGRAYKPFGRP